MLFGSCVAVLVLAVLFGGGTSIGFLGDAVAQAAAVPLLCIALWPLMERSGWDAQRRAIAVVFLSALAIVALQLFPLPFHIWSGGEKLLSRSGTAGIAPSTAWDTFSLTPQATWAAAVSLLVPIAVFSAVVRLDFQQRRLLCWIVLGLGVLSLVIGFLQVAQGPGSGLRFYSYTNLTEAVGFFANRNHFAALIVVSLVLVGYWSTMPRVGARPPASSLLIWAVIALTFVALVTGVMLARSRAGFFLAMLAIGGGAAIFFAARTREDMGGRENRASSQAVATVAIIAMLFAVQFGIGRLLTRFEGDFVDDLRLRFAGATLQTAIKSLPFGTGLGSFVPVYSAVEKSDDVHPGYANRAHNDFAEIFLETGVIGAFVILAFLAWFSNRSWTVWKAPPVGEARDVTALNRTAVVILALLLAHSIVDYPLRTTALAAIFALFCGILAVPATYEVQPKPKPRRGRHHSRGEVKREAWASEIAWPEDWRRTGASS
ncbi:O-antigen ligase family protein [Rhodomicrobium lacus]|uniref:O-antigen ligase family protein n=1 Tax=Rhodomicrobium lacus TaxID=2498452 RepID=UPI000F8F696A|nr:O-antigen ligase family protein [Rhodomicrobium lacus]